MSKWTRADTEGVIVGSLCGGVTGYFADTVNFHPGIATTIGVSISIAVYCMWYGIRSEK